jgi:hypothetical protein
MSEGRVIENRHNFPLEYLFESLSLQSAGVMKMTGKSNSLIPTVISPPDVPL